MTHVPAPKDFIREQLDESNIVSKFDRSVSLSSDQIEDKEIQRMRDKMEKNQKESKRFLWRIHKRRKLMLDVENTKLVKEMKQMEFKEDGIMNNALLFI